MVKMQVVYEGELRCRLTHGPSGQQIITDAPVDNFGKGQSFSPTDMVASSLGACVLTIMGIVAKRHQIDLIGAKVEVSKEMVMAPVRRIGTISLMIYMPKGIDASQRKMLENAADTCPVHKSLHPDVKTPMQFIYPD